MSKARHTRKKQFEAPAPKRSKAPLLLLIPVLALAGIYMAMRARGDRFEEVGEPGQDIRIPVADVSGGHARFYRNALAGGQRVDFFVLRSSDGVVRAAFDTCDVCFKARRGYRQERDDMVCNQCGRHFPSVGVNEIRGGCNPAPLARTVEGGDLVIRARDLALGAIYF